MSTKARRLLKAITWRLVASGATFLFSLLFFQDSPNLVEKSAGLVASLIVVKIALFYLHEIIYEKWKG